MAEAINWQEKYVNYVEGDLPKDIQKLEYGQKALDAKIEARVQELKDGQKVLDANLRRAEENLRQEIRDLGTKMDTKMDKLGTNINLLPYIIAGAAIVALMGGIVGGLITLFVR